MIASSSLAPPLPPSCVVNTASRFPLGGQTQAPDPAVLAGHSETTDQDKSHALVVDDAPDVTEMIALLLKYAGYAVTPVYSGTQALAAARVQQYDVLISDIGMPGMNGYELAEQVRGL